MRGVSFLALGAAMGLRHALDPDHLIAVSVMVAEVGSFRPATKVGALWGLGHTLTLLVFGTPLLLLKLRLPERVQAGFEGLVGLMLIFLGGATLWRLFRRRLHLHWHDHRGHRHLHFHDHPEKSRPFSHHDHDHLTFSMGWRPFFVGMVHGLAGSGAAALMVMVSAPSFLVGIGYLFLFGIGSIAGMMVTAIFLCLPVWVAQRRLIHGHSMILGLAGAISVVFGASLLSEVTRIFLSA